MNIAIEAGMALKKERKKNKKSACCAHNWNELCCFLSLSLSFTVQPDPWNTHVWKGVNGTPTKKRAIGFKKLAKWVGEELETFALFVFFLSTKCMLSLTCTTLPRPAVCSAPNLCQPFVVILTQSSGTSVSGCVNGCLRVLSSIFSSQLCWNGCK